VAAIGATGLYGKLPCLGDFVRRGLPDDFVAPWDDWLQEGLLESRRRLGESWQEIYLSSPLWRFVLPAGFYGSTAWAGVLMPSVDRVGRCFPLAAAAPLGEGAQPFAIVRHQGAWFAQLEELLLAALDHRPEDLESFWNALAGLSSGDLGPSPVLAAVLNGNGAWVGLPSVEAADEAFIPLLGSWAGGKSIWWTSGSQLVPPGLWLHPAPPRPETYAALLDGRWQVRGEGNG
jgi:type VI secretion system protein ImpM